MQLLTEKTIIIHRPTTEVFDFIANMENFGLWFPGVISIVSCNANAHGKVGKQYLETVKIPLRGHQEINITVREALRGELFVTEGAFAPLYPRMEIRLQAPDDFSCLLTWRMCSRSENRAFKMLVLPLVKLVIGTRATKGVKQLRELLEKNPASNNVIA